ncbi:uncharacterized protein LOC132258016 [Phlebotomus argentipes]|uniref:uncharacterized protein LOC132258016 n=1 Tax=Phlebotomus argentipes TaxID=94469 RepID=UPI002892A5D4|nr:uncharacterized protein LOC132258016 [Phlebotomus argentipes]
MFSMCSKALPNTPTIRTKVDRTEVTTNYDNNKEQYASTAGKQIKGGYLLRYKRQLLWNRWEEEWVVLYDDSTMAWFTEPGRSSPAGKILVKEAPEMLAIAHWTGQIPRRPPLPGNCTVSQLIALGSRRKKSKVYWMLAKSEQEVGEWISAISKTLPPPPQIELIVDKPNLIGVLKRPLVRIRPATSSEIFARKTMSDNGVHNPAVSNDAAVAVLKKSTGNQDDSSSRGSLACVLPWGHGWGWSTLPNGVWSGELTWSQCEDSFTLHALPTNHCTNYADTSIAGIYHTDVETGIDFHSTGVEELGVEDFDYAMDCGDFLF